ncbi:MAG TPA: hypothetical protein VGC39_03245 [Candidatus Methylacidiphilales bacterium]
MNTFLSRSFLTALLFLATGGAMVRAGELFSPAPADEVSVRTIPAFTVIETEVTDSLDAGWAKGFRLGARYAAMAHTGLNTPTLITFPDWDKNPTAEGNKLHLLIQCLIDPLPDLPKVHDRGASLEQMPAMTVACCAHMGAYSPANFMLCLKKIEDHLHTQRIPAIGPPRYLYYSNTSWYPSSWRIGEVQVPIAAGGRN